MTTQVPKFITIASPTYWSMSHQYSRIHNNSNNSRNNLRKVKEQQCERDGQQGFEGYQVSTGNGRRQVWNSYNSQEHGYAQGENREGVSECISSQYAASSPHEYNEDEGDYLQDKLDPVVQVQGRSRMEDRPSEQFSQESKVSGKSTGESQSSSSGSVHNRTGFSGGGVTDSSWRTVNLELAKACEVMAVTRGREQDLEKIREADTQSKVERHTKNLLFRKIKFIADQEELGSLQGKSSIGNMVMDHMKIDDQSKRYSWWMAYQGCVKHAMDQQRGNCNVAVKDVVVGKKEQCAA
jgi:hypothetical protein